MATTIGSTKSATTDFRLSPTQRKCVLNLHIVSGIGWMGVDIALALLLTTGLRTDNG